MTKLKFPSQKYSSASSFTKDYQAVLNAALDLVDKEQIDSAANRLFQAIEEDASILICGNGGSSAIANHVTCDYVKILGLAYDKPVRVTSLNSNSELNFAISNDISFDEVFSFQVKQLGKPGDVLWTVSSSGNSPNIARAIETAHSKQMDTIAFCGFEGGRSSSLAKFPVYVPFKNYGVVEDAHQVLTHTICQYLKHLVIDTEKLGELVF